MDEMKWAWVLFVAATLALLIRLAMWFLPAPGWRSDKVSQAAEAIPAAAQAEGPVESPLAEGAPESLPAEPETAPEQAAAMVFPEPAPVPPAPPPAPASPVPPPEEFHLRHARWGMSLAEVRASEQGEPLRANDYGLVYAVNTLDLPCLLAYSFEGGRLVRARMSFSDPSGVDIPPLSVAQAQRRFLYLREQLRSRYGEPLQKTVTLPRDLSDLKRNAQKQDELAKQYDVEIAEAERRLQKQRAVLEARFKRWSNAPEMVARGLASYERDLKELRTWKQEAVARADQSRKNIQQHQDADALRPLIATLTARWPFARELHDVELKLDCRSAVPRLEIRYEAAQISSNGRKTEL